MNNRTIIVNSSNGVPAQQITTVAQTWGELQRELVDAGVNYSGMKAIIGESKVELLDNNASLGEGDFNLFLMPRKTKSGSDNLNEPSKKSTKKEPMATSKKSAPAKKIAPAKKVVAPKKIAPAKAIVSNKKESVEQPQAVAAPISPVINIEEAIAAAEKAMSDITKVQKAINLLKSIDNDRVRTKMVQVVNMIDDMAYILATGKPRIDNLKSKQTAQELANGKIATS